MNIVMFIMRGIAKHNNIIKHWLELFRGTLSSAAVNMTHQKRH
jgi:hypothetical protein